MPTTHSAHRRSDFLQVSVQTLSSLCNRGAFLVPSRLALQTHRSVGFPSVDALVCGAVPSQSLERVYITPPQHAVKACFIIIHASGMTLSTRSLDGVACSSVGHVTDELRLRLDEEEEEEEGGGGRLDGEPVQLQEKGLERPSYTTSLNTPV